MFLTHSNFDEPPQAKLTSVVRNVSLHTVIHIYKEGVVIENY